MVDVLLHLATTADWRAALGAGVIAPPSLAEAGFVHLSTPDQVHLPAERLFAGRDDVVLLVLDPARIDVEVRYEPGVPGDPASMRFPHAYGPVPTAAVLAVAPYRPGADGFTAPVLGPADVAGRAMGFEPALVRRVATGEVPITGGVAVLTPAVAGSYQHNQLVVDGESDAATVVAEADAVLGGAGLPHRMALLVGEHLRPVATGLGELGWTPSELVVMAGSAGGEPSGRVERVDVETLRPWWATMWRRTIPGVTDAVITDLADRYLLEDRVCDDRHLVVRADGATGPVVASALLSIDGATAWLNDVETDPAHRGNGHGDLLVTEARALAAAAGCDIVALGAEAADWPRTWYARRGFTEVGRCWTALGRPRG